MAVTEHGTKCRAPGQLADRPRIPEASPGVKGGSRGPVRRLASWLEGTGLQAVEVERGGQVTLCFIGGKTES